MLHQIVHVQVLQLAPHKKQKLLVTALEGNVVTLLEHSYLLPQSLRKILVQQYYEENRVLDLRGSVALEEEAGLVVKRNDLSNLCGRQCEMVVLVDGGVQIDKVEFSDEDEVYIQLGLVVVDRDQRLAGLLELFRVDANIVTESPVFVLSPAVG